MKIFLTGESGFLGKNINEKFQKEHEIFLYKRGMDINKELLKVKPDIIIHSAAEIYDSNKMFDSNIKLTYDILTYCSKNKINKLIYFGSSSEYGKTHKKMSEKKLINPESLYAATKSCGTLLCQAFSRVYNFNCYIIRPFSIYGKHEPKHRLIPTIFKKAFSEEKLIITHGWHDFFYIKDFLKIINIILNNNETATGDILNAGYGKQFSNEEVVKKIEKITNKKIKYEIKNNIKKEDSKTWICDTSLLREKYNFFPEYNFNQGLQEYFNNNEWI